MSSASRVAATIAAVLLFVVLLSAVAGLPKYGESRGPYERRRAIESVRTRHATNLNAFINFDYRGFDTLGEEFIFFIAVAGFAVLLRERRDARTAAEDRPLGGRHPRRDPALGVAMRLAVPVLVVYGAYIVVHGQLTPGGGFQGGAVLATAALALFLALDFAAYERLVSKAAVEAFESIGATGYVVFGVASVFVAGTFLRNFLPIGATGSLVSSGQILALNDLVGVAVTGGFVVIFSEFMKETRAADRSAD